MAAIWPRPLWETVAEAGRGSGLRPHNFVIFRHRSLTIDMHITRYQHYLNLLLPFSILEQFLLPDKVNDKVEHFHFFNRILEIHISFNFLANCLQLLHDKVHTLPISCSENLNFISHKRKWQPVKLPPVTPFVKKSIWGCWKTLNFMVFTYFRELKLRI